MHTLKPYFICCLISIFTTSVPQPIWATDRYFPPRSDMVNDSDSDVSTERKREQNNFAKAQENISTQRLVVPTMMAGRWTDTDINPYFRFILDWHVKNWIRAQPEWKTSNPQENNNRRQPTYMPHIEDVD